MATVALDPMKRVVDNDRLRIRNVVALTKSDTDELVRVPKGLLCTVAGNINVIMADGGTTQVALAVLAGVFYPLEIKQLMSTSTTATVVACY